MLVADVRDGGVSTHTRVSGDVVKPSMYNCFTLIKTGGGGGDHRGPRVLTQSLSWGLEGEEGGLRLLEVVGMQLCEPPCFGQAKPGDRCGARGPQRMKHSSLHAPTNHFPN